MKLFYWKSEDGNVGDDLNDWLWPRVLKDKLDQDESHLLLGIGTLLNNAIPDAKNYTVLSSGAGYGTLPHVDKKWHFVAVRGPRTAELMSAPKDTVQIDGAYLSNRFIDVSNIKKKHNFSYIPHHHSMYLGPWQRFQSLSGINVIDPRSSVESFVKQVCESKVVVCEAMHGAIFADAFSVPWIPAVMYEHINQEKWYDWTEALNCKFEFNFLPPIWVGDQLLPNKLKYKNLIKRILLKMGMFKERFDDLPPWQSSNASMKECANALRQLAAEHQGYLSDRAVMNEKIDQLVKAIELHFQITITPSTTELKN